MGEDERDEEAPADSRNDRESAAAAASLDKLTDHVCTPPPSPPPTMLSPTRSCPWWSSSAEVQIYLQNLPNPDFAPNHQRPSGNSSLSGVS